MTFPARRITTPAAVLLVVAAVLAIVLGPLHLSSNGSTAVARSTVSTQLTSQHTLHGATAESNAAAAIVTFPAFVATVPTHAAAPIVHVTVTNPFRAVTGTWYSKTTGVTMYFGTEHGRIFTINGKSIKLARNQALMCWSAAGNGTDELLINYQTTTHGYFLGIIDIDAVPFIGFKAGAVVTLSAHGVVASFDPANPANPDSGMADPIPDLQLVSR